jgi:cytochrome c-type biogenesis protein
MVAYLLGLARGAGVSSESVGPGGPEVPGSAGGSGRRGGAAHSPERWRAALVGACVLAGVLTLMTAVAIILTLLNASLAGLLPLLLPPVYVAVIALGGLLAAGRNPLARAPMPGGDLPRRPYLAAFRYGLLLGPMTLPCTGPIVMSAFVLGLSAPGFLLDGLAYFAAFGLGFGWPLIVLPVLAAGASRRFTAWLGRRHALLTRLSGWLLMAIGVFGLVVEVAPNLL